MNKSTKPIQKCKQRERVPKIISYFGGTNNIFAIASKSDNYRDSWKSNNFRESIKMETDKKSKLFVFQFIKNVSSSISHKKITKIQEIKKILPSTFIYESILIKK